MKIILAVGVIILVVLSIIGFKFSRFGVESPQYNVVEKDGAFEIRDYPEMVLVSTGMENADRQLRSALYTVFFEAQRDSG
jgi:hypothetical protein